MPSNQPLNCRVCGLEQETPPWGDDGNTPNYEICDCCGVEFGYEDSTVDSVRRYRSVWIEKGAPWFQARLKPPNWNIEEQLAQIPSLWLRDIHREGDDRSNGSED